MGKLSRSKLEERLAHVKVLIEEEDEFKTAKKEVLEIIKGIPDDRAYAPFMIEADLLMSEALKALAEFKKALEHAERAVKAAGDIRDDRLLAMALRQQGHVLIRTSEFDTAVDLVQRGLDISRELKDEGLEGLARIELANILYLKGEPRKAETELREAVLLLEKVGDRRSVARAYNNLATYIHAQGDRERAVEFFEKTKVMSRKARAVRYMGLAMMNKAGVLIELKRLEEARVEADGALRIFEEKGDRFLQAATYMIFGLIHAEREEWEEAEDMLQKARLMTKKMGMPTTAGYMLFEIGKVCVRKGERERGLRHIEEARAIFEEHGSANVLRVLDEFLKDANEEG